VDKEHQIPIWFFIGLVLTLYGTVILAAGIYHLFYPSARVVALQHLHPELWWPGVLLGIGLVYVIRYAPWRSRNAVPPNSRTGS
jgi:integral membrane sensor domain MASE1